MISLTGWLFEQETDEQLRIVEYLSDIISDKFGEIKVSRHEGQSNKVDVKYYFQPTGFSLSFFGENKTIFYLEGGIFLKKKFSSFEELEVLVGELFSELYSSESKQTELKSFLQKIKQQSVEYFSNNSGYRIDEIKEKSFNVFIVDIKAILGREIPNDLQYEVVFKQDLKFDRIYCFITAKWANGWNSYKKQLSFDFSDGDWSFKHTFETSFFQEDLERQIQGSEF